MGLTFTHFVYNAFAPKTKPSLSNSTNKMSIIKLKTSDDDIIDIDLEVAKVSGTIKNLIDDLGISEEDNDEVVPLPTISTANLKIVIEWAVFHKSDPPLTEDEEFASEQKTDDLCEWDKGFVKKMDWPTMYHVIMAANYLDIQKLLDVLCKTVAHMIKTCNIEEIRENCKIKNDFTEEEEEEIQKTMEKEIENDFTAEEKEEIQKTMEIEKLGIDESKKK